MRARVLGVIILILVSALSMAAPISAQDGVDDESPVAETAPAQGETTDLGQATDIQAEETVVTEEPLTETPIDEPPAEPVDPVPTENPELTVEAEQSSEPEPTATEIPVQAVLNYAGAESPSCVERNGNDAIVAGGELIYDCTYTVALAGQHLDPSAIVLDWSIDAVASGDFNVQLLIPSNDADHWTEGGQSEVEREWQSTFAVAGQGVVSTLDDSATLEFSLAIARPACSELPGSLELAVGGMASMPTNPETYVSDATSSRSSIILQPELLPLDDSLPTVSIQAVSIAPVEFSLSPSETTGSLTIEVDNPTLQCKASKITVSVQASAGGSAIESALLSWVGPLDESTIAAAAPVTDSEGHTLDRFIVISSVPAYAEPGSYQQTISFDLTVPAAVGAGTYQVAVSAVVDSAE